MLVSWNWIREYLDLAVSHEEFAERLMLVGLNHEEANPVGRDYAIDLEVTSNRPDCLGHLGIAREGSVVFGTPLKLPAANPPVGKTAVTELAKVSVECPTLCPRYTARVIRGVKVKPSPAWLTERLATIGIAAINNVVDITNYVLMECGQPLHAFDLAKLAGREIVVREAGAGEKLEAINHKTYELASGMCVIADRDNPVGLAGVMGGASTEVSSATSEVLLEAAEFEPMSIRATARKLVLHSDSSYRFERGLDPAGVDWASRRACQLMLDLCGGELASGVIDIGQPAPPRQPVVLRLAQLKRVLGIEIPAAEVERILVALGSEKREADANSIEVIPPTWRRDLTREIDLVEEVARIHGYDNIPENVNVPMAASHRTRRDRVLGKTREALVAAGCDEAMTISVVDEADSAAFSPWSDAAPLVASTAVLRRADRLRRSLVPSLLGARKNNEAIGNPGTRLFEIARAYLPQAKGLPQEPLLLCLVAENFAAVKGVVESIVARLNASATLTASEYRHELFSPGHAATLYVNGKLLGYIGELASPALKKFELREPTAVVEVQIETLEAIAELIPRAAELSPFPAVVRDLNLVVDERIQWADLLTTATRAAGPDAEAIEYRDSYRDTQRIGVGKKSQLFSVVLRRADRTLTSGEADAVRDAIVAACAAQHGATLRA